MTRRTQWAVGILSVALCWGFGTGLAGAVPTLSFDNPTVDGGTISYAGAGGAVTATGVIFQQVIGVDTPLNPGTVLFCFPANCELSFTTGPSTGLEGPPIWTFDGGGTVSMTGGLNTAADGSGTQILPGGSILVSSGSFGSPEVGNGTDSNLMFTGSGTDTKNTTLAGFYGLANPFTFVTTELSLGGAAITPATGAFTATVTDADFQNTAAALLQIPLPPSGLLVGFGLLLMGSTRALRRFV
jgi:hypothetical protein